MKKPCFWCRKKDLYKKSILRYCVKYYDKVWKEVPLVETIAKITTKRGAKFPEENMT